MGPILPMSEFRKFSVFGTEIFICYRGNIIDFKLKLYRSFKQFSDQHVTIFLYKKIGE